MGGGVKEMTQAERVLNYIKEFGSITTLDAFRDLGVTRLSASIFILKDMGFNIQGKFETVINRYGDKCSIKRYYFGDEDIKSYFLGEEDESTTIDK